MDSKKLRTIVGAVLVALLTVFVSVTTPTLGADGAVVEPAALEVSDLVKQIVTMVGGMLAGWLGANSPIKDKK